MADDSASPLVGKTVLVKRHGLVSKIVSKDPGGHLNLEGCETKPRTSDLIFVLNGLTEEGREELHAHFVKKNLKIPQFARVTFEEKGDDGTWAETEESVLDEVKLSRQVMRTPKNGYKTVKPHCVGCGELKDGAAVDPNAGEKRCVLCTKYGDGEEDADDSEEEEEIQQKAGKGGKREADESEDESEDDSDDEEGEGKPKGIDGTVACSISEEGDGRLVISLENDDADSKADCVMSLSGIQAYQKRLEAKGDTEEAARAKVLDLITRQANRTALHRQALVLQYAAEDADKFERDKVDPKVEELEGKIEEARADIAETEGHLEGVKRRPRAPQREAYTQFVIAEVDGKKKEIAADERKTKRLKRSVPGKFDELVDEGKERAMVSHGTPEKAKGLYLAVRANKYG